METILIAGGFGFVGKNIAEQLSSKYRIVLIDKDISKDFAKDNRIIYYQKDLNNKEDIKNILEKELPDYIINLASIVTAERNIVIFEEMLSINFKVFLSLYEATLNLSSLKLFIQFGSAEEYGNIKPHFSESDRESPKSPYALVKQLTTNTAIMFNKNFGFPVCSLRAGNIFGKYQNKKKFIPYIISALLCNEPLEVSPCEQKRDFIHVVDFIRILDKIIVNYKNVKGEILNVSSGESHSLKEIIIFCKNEINSKSVITFGALSYRENEIMNFVCNISKVENIIGEKINFDFFSKLKMVINMMRK